MPDDLKIDTRDLISRLLSPSWEPRLEKLGDTAKRHFGIIEDTGAHDEELQWGLVFFPMGRENPRFSVILEIGSWERMDNILSWMERDRKFDLPRVFQPAYPRGCIEFPWPD
jgi:hypothetical protein